MIQSRYKLSLPIPIDCISLSDARKAMMRAAIPHLCTRHRWEQEEELAQEWRDRILRSALVDGELVGLVTGLNDESRKLRASEWVLPAKLINTPDGHIVDHGDDPGFVDDYVAPGEPCRHGPDTTLGKGKHRPVFFVQADFNRWLNQHGPNHKTDDDGIVHSGAPGRPTSKHLVQAEHTRRVAVGEAVRGVTREATILHTWLQRNHKKMPQMSVNTIENAIRKAHRAAGLIGKIELPRK
jgi:hypothetical protein